jgi:capsular polysaccharide biosynthesis protein
MSQQALNLRRSVQIVLRHRVLMAVAIILGILVGAAYGKLDPPKMTSTALVVLPQPAQSAQANADAGTGTDPYTATEEVIAGSTRVLSGALPDVRPSVSLIQLRRELQIGSLTDYVISISASVATAADAEATANAVANSYISYIGSAESPGGRVPAQLLEPASTAAGLQPLEVLIIDALIGALSGLLLGAIIALAISRGDRRLRGRDEIANSIGVPVVASFPVAHPSDAAGWTRLLEDYKPEVMQALQLRQVLHHLGTASVNGDGRDRSSVTILSLASDSAALALGPQLAAFAAAQGIPTALVIGPQQDQDATATLRTACAAPRAGSSKWPGQLQVVVSGEHTDVPDTALTVVVMAVDGQTPRLPDGVRSTATLLGVSSGAATAEQLARAAVSADAGGREITGILVANPEPADHTTGRISQVSRASQHRLPTRLKGMITELRR